MNALVTTPTEPSEDSVLAGKLVGAFGQMVRLHEKHFGLSPEEAVRRAAGPPGDGGERALNGPPDQVSWFDLHLVAQTDPDRAAARWEEIKQAALDELRTGYRAAVGVETINDGAWQRAQFLALREELAADWQPRNGIERQLLDTMAQAQAAYLSWLHILAARTNLESWSTKRRQEEEGKWAPPRQSDADALEQAAAMMDRYNRVFLRTLRALSDLRRHSNPVIVQNGGQMHVAQNQVNVSAKTPRKGDYARPGKSTLQQPSGKG
jgi:hypothetical protein